MLKMLTKGKILVIFSVFFIMTSCGDKNHYDIIIKGGNVYDGNGAESAIADIGIIEDQIIEIGDLSGESSNLEINAEGLAVAPGFIDMHTHLEPLMNMPNASSHITQGVTTALGGPDGGGPWPFGSYLDSLEGNYKLSMNVAYLTGHNTIRRNVMGTENRPPTDEELEEMKSMVAQSMKEGAFGISTGLKYLPGTFSETEEIIELSKVAANYGGIYTSHLREEGLGLIEGVNEAIIIGSSANIPIVLTHHKAMGKPMWGASQTTISMVDSARIEGIDVMMDQYPYTASHTGISVLIPTWAMAGGAEAFEERVHNPILRDSILRGIEFNIINDRGGGDLGRVQFARVKWMEELEGLTLKDYANMMEVDPTPENGALLVMDIQLKGGANCIFHAMSEEDVERIMQHPMTMHASDGRLNMLDEGHPHPRAYGTFPRILGYYVREKGVLTLEEAISKMTSLPADRLGLTERGRIKEGNIADIVIFDPDQITDVSTFEDPHHYSEGIKWLLVNGSVVIQEEKITENRPGRVLRGEAYIN